MKREALDYGLAVLAVAAAFLVRIALDPVLGDAHPFATFYVAVAVAAWYGGWRPALLALVLGLLLGDWFFVSPRGTFVHELSPARLVGTGLYAFVGVAFAVLTELMRRAEEARKGRERERGELLAAAEHARDDAEAALAIRGRIQAIADAAVAELPLDRFMHGLLLRTREALRTDTALILMRSAPGEELQVRAAVGLEDEMLERLRIRIDPAFEDRIASERRALVWNENHPGPIMNPLVREKGLRAMIGAPLVSGDQLIGVIHVGSVEPRTFRADELALLQLAADRIALGIERTRRRETELRARGVAEAANRAKDAFLATVSHELRAPLAPILTWARMLRDGKLDADQSRNALQVIERSARTQAQIVEDLLDVSRIIAGKMRLEVRPVHLAPIIEAAIEVVQPAAEAKGIRLTRTLDTEAGPISGDPGRLQQVVWNLLSNAVKFTPRGGRVQVVLERVNSNVEIAVSDNGKGISPDFLSRAFERFQQADSSSARTHTGLGLGLAIVRHLVELHGGTVHVESEGDGQGTVFTVKLPLAMARTAGETERRHPSGRGMAERPLPTLDGLRILVVDDEPDTNEVVRMLLASQGAEVRTAGSVRQALAELARWNPELLISDIGMPGEDGYALINQVRAQRGAAGEVPAIALTAYAGIDDRVRLLAAGFQMHVAKPIEPAELVAVVASLGRAGGRP